MKLRWPPWWVCLGLLSCTVYASIWAALAVVGPEPPGMAIRPGQKGQQITLIQAGMAADRAGLKVGDLVLSINGRAPNVVIREMGPSAWVGSRYEMLIERDGERKTIPLLLGRHQSSYWADPEGAVYLVDIFNSLVCLALAFAVAFLRPQETGARLGALFLAAWPILLIHSLHFPFAGFYAVVRSWPAPLAAIPFLAVCLAGSAFVPLGLSLFTSFPRRMIRARWVWVLIWAAAPYWLFTTINVNGPRFFAGLTAYPVPRPFVAPSILLRIVYALAVPVVLALNYRGLENVNERRRVRFLVLGVAVSSLVYLPELAGSLIPGLGPLLLRYWTSPLFVLSAVVAASGPFCIGHAIVRHRLFDIRLMIRQGLQYAVARGLLAAAVPVLAGILVLDLVLHSDQTLGQAFSQRGWFYLALAAVALAAHSRRKKWLAALDRRFFRERYNAQQVLRGVVEEVRQAPGLEPIAPRVLEQLDTALHPEFASLLVRRPGDDRFRPLVSCGECAALPAIQNDSKLIGLARLLGKPVEIPHTDTDWLARQLPKEESTALRQWRLEWLYPISLGRTALEALLALGPRRSEEPYSQEDQDLLASVVSALALLVERGGTLPPYASGPTVTHVMPALPQPIGERYFFERQLGAGGMGTVYEARDAELERRVAIKLIRTDLMESPEAAARFKREARSAAAFAHPNVVTVYDFGVADGGRAYLVMELLEGASLRSALEQPRLPAGRAGAVMKDICAALDAAHQRRLLHRDLKPENVFLVRINDLELSKILDFGIAKTLSDGAETLTAAQTKPGQLLGTLKYMSPEQLRGGDPAESWDLWALAVVGYELVTGAYPFDLSTAAGWQAAVLAGKFAPVASHLGEPAPAWDDFFARALAAEQSRRPSSARELYTEFNRALMA